MDVQDDKQIFVSYSTVDADKADAIRAALEASGITCWFAPRDLKTGAQWGGGIVDAIENCKAMLVVFSAASNDSPQVARELQLAVSNRKPLIPVRIQDVAPTKDMQYFLGVSHWFNAYPQPIGAYLPDIVGATQGVLKDKATTWGNFSRRLPRSNVARAGLAAGLVALTVLAVGALKPRDPMAAFKPPLTGRWTTTIKGENGSAKCLLDVQSTSQIVYSEDCPAPVQNARGSLTWSKDGIWAPTLFKSGDSGSFLFQGGSAHGYAAAFKLGWGGLTTRDATLGEIKWRKTSGAEPIRSAADDIAPRDAAWPMGDMPAMAKKAQDYARAHWQKDAVLMAIQAQKMESMSAAGGIPTPDGGVNLSFEFYSPSAQQGLRVSPRTAQTSYVTGTRDQDPGQALPARFMDLPRAFEIAQANGMRAKRLSEAKLEWTGGPACGTGNFAIDNAILPVCRPGRYVGPQWLLESELSERMWIKALPDV